MYYRTSDLREYLSIMGIRNDRVLQEFPMKSNYTIKNNVTSYGVSSSVAEVYESFHRSNNIILRHINLNGLNDNCYIEVSARQAHLLGIYLHCDQ